MPIRRASSETWVDSSARSERIRSRCGLATAARRATSRSTSSIRHPSDTCKLYLTRASKGVSLLEERVLLAVLAAPPLDPEPLDDHGVDQRERREDTGGGRDHAGVQREERDRPHGE